MLVTPNLLSPGLYAIMCKCTEMHEGTPRRCPWTAYYLLSIYSCQIFTRNGLSPLLVMYDMYLLPDVVSVILVWARTELNVSALTSIEKPRGNLSLEKFPSSSELRVCGFTRASASNSTALRYGFVVAMFDMRLPCTMCKMICYIFRSVCIR